MRSIVLGVITALALGGPVRAGIITDYFTSIYVFGDSLSDDGNVIGLAWLAVTGGSPYQGNWRDGGTFTNGDVWNEPLQREFRNAGRDADNFAVGGALASGGNLLFPDLDDQISKLLASTSPKDRGANSLATIWIGGNNVTGAVGDGNALGIAVAAAKTVAKGISRLASKAGVGNFLVFNLPDLSKIPDFRLFNPGNKAEAKAAGKAYNAELAKRLNSLEEEGLNIIDVDVYSLFGDVFADPESFGFADVKLPCVFPNKGEAKRYGQSERCSNSTAKKRLFMDSLHPNAHAHEIIGDLARQLLKDNVRSHASRFAMSAAYAREAVPAPVPLPSPAALLLAALGALGAIRLRLRRASVASA